MKHQELETRYSQPLGTSYRRTMFSKPGYTLAARARRLFGGFMFGLGFPELLLILIIVVFLFGAGRLASVGRGLGEGIAGFRDAMKKSEDKPAIEEKKNS
jgi:sec-independent protein translocase protein TatA